MFDETMQVQLLFKISGVGNTEQSFCPLLTYKPTHYYPHLCWKYHIKETDERVAEEKKELIEIH